MKLELMTCNEYTNRNVSLLLNTLLGLAKSLIRSDNCKWNSPLDEHVNSINEELELV